MKRMSWLLSLVGLSIILSGCSSRVAVKVPTRSAKGFVATTAYHHHTIEQTELHKFVHDKLVTSEGIYTNCLASDKQQSQATGHEMLLESSGLWLTYLAQTKQNKTFRRSYQQTVATFGQGDQLSYGHGHNVFQEERRGRP